MSIRDRLHDEAQELQKLRDELRVQMHLGKLDAQELWDQLEKQWDHAEGKLKQLGDASRESAEEIGDATQLVLDEVKRGYERLKGLL